jgi:hypothetical protein
MQMVTDSRYEDLDRRLRTAESDIVGDRHVSQYAADQARRGTEALIGLRSEIAALRADVAALRADIGATGTRVDAQGENLAAVNSMLIRHGRALEVLMQDVRELRTVIRNELIAVRQEATDRHAELVAAIRALGGGTAG